MDGAVVGMIDVALIDWPNFVQPYAWVPDLIVTDNARGKGIGAALLSRAEEVAREVGASALGLESAHWRTGAHQFYLRQGMADAARHFIKVLADVPWPPPAAGGDQVMDAPVPPAPSAPERPS
jgi:GNAT superfamily N-acetyltransferase